MQKTVKKRIGIQPAVFFASQKIFSLLAFDKMIKIYKQLKKKLLGGYL